MLSPTLIQHSVSHTQTKKPPQQKKAKRENTQKKTIKQHGQHETKQSHKTHKQTQTQEPTLKREQKHAHHIKQNIQ